MLINKFKAVNWLYALPVALYFTLAFVYLFAIPVGESPDEPGHLQCIEQVSLLNRLPITEPAPEGRWSSRGVIISGHMCYHMPLYYVVSGYLQQVIAAVTQEPIHYEFPPMNPDFGKKGDLSSLALFTHPDKPSFWNLAEPITVIGLRLLSIGLGLVTVFAGAYVARQLVPDNEYVPLLAAVIIAGWPQFVYLSRSINNDILATALAAGILIILVNVGSPKRFVAAAFLSALAVLSKMSVAFTVGAVIGSWFLEIVMLRQQKRAYLRALVVMLMIWLGTGLLIAYQPTIHKHFLYSSRAFSTISPRVGTFDYWKQVFDLTLSSGWARLGWMNVAVPMQHAYMWWGGLALAGGSGLVLLWRRVNTQQARLLLLILALWCGGVFVSYLNINLNRLQPQFRFALAVLPVFAAFSASGLLRWVNGKRFVSRTLVTLFALLMLAYNLWFVTAVVAPVYGW